MLIPVASIFSLSIEQMNQKRTVVLRFIDSRKVSRVYKTFLSNVEALRERSTSFRKKQSNDKVSQPMQMPDGGYLYIRAHNTSYAHEDLRIQMTANWFSAGGVTLGKPTEFERLHANF